MNEDLCSCANGPASALFIYRYMKSCKECPVLATVPTVTDLLVCRHWRIPAKANGMIEPSAAD